MVALQGDVTARVLGELRPLGEFAVGHATVEVIAADFSNRQLARRPSVGWGCAGTGRTGCPASSAAKAVAAAVSNAVKRDKILNVTCNSLRMVILPGIGLVRD